MPDVPAAALERLVRTARSERRAPGVVAAVVHDREQRFAQEGPDRFRVASGRERGEALLVVRAADATVEHMLWATYALTRAPQVFGAGAGG